MLSSLPDGYRALVIGAQGGLGAAFVQHLQADPRCGAVWGAVRSPQATNNEVRLDLQEPASIEQAAGSLRPHGPFHVLIDATGVLTMDGIPPEKRLADLDAQHMARIFAVNAIGPALMLKHMVELLPAKGRCIAATLSARVGSIGDNRKGGWYSYRASKAALNMLWRTASIEVARRRPEAVLLALHPGTVFSNLSAPFVAPGEVHPGLMHPQDAAARLLTVMDTARESGSFKAWDGQTIEW
jgi:NAD(P)-dependent dehydrogenase (short-subunit alcohol dehydrogenase family)